MIQYATGTTPPQCLPPRPVRAPGTFAVAAGAWDVHAHLIDGSDHVSFIRERSYTPCPASPDAYIAMLERVGITYAAPTRTIWGSDWPNVALFDSWQLPETGAQLDALKKHIGSEEKLHAVLVENPKRLFGLPGTAVRVPQ